MTEITKTFSAWVARDGREFSTPKACKAHEDILALMEESDAILDAFKVFSCEMTPLKYEATALVINDWLYKGHSYSVWYLVRPTEEAHLEVLRKRIAFWEKADDLYICYPEGFEDFRVNEVYLVIESQDNGRVIITDPETLVKTAERNLSVMTDDFLEDFRRDLSLMA